MAAGNSTLKFALVSATFLTYPAYAQQFYGGGSLGFSDFDYDGTNTGSYSSSGGSIALFGGVRFGLNQASSSGMFIGGEVEVAYENGYSANLAWDSIDNSASSYQGELHLGFRSDNVTYFGFVGVGQKNVSHTPDLGESNYKFVGLGADIGLSENLALRIEAEIGEMSIDSCDSYDLRKTEINCGLVFTF